MYDFYIKNLMLSSIIISLLLLCRKSLHKYLSENVGYILCKLIILELLPVWIPIYVANISSPIMGEKHTTEILPFLHGTGFTVLIVIGMVSYCRTLFAIKKIQVESDREITMDCISIVTSSRMKKKRNITIISSKGVSAPFSFGIWHHYIVIPCYLAENERNLTCVLQHELTHIDSNDCLWKMISYVLCCYYWFFPFAWLLYFYMDQECELSCDAKTLQSLGDSFKKDYLKTILLCCTESQRYSVSSLVQPFGSSHASLKERMNVIMKKPKRKLGISILLLVMMCVICLFGHLQFKAKATVDHKNDDRVIESISSDKDMESDTISYEKEDPDDDSTVTVIKKQATD